MKLLLDENLPKKLKQDFIEFDTYSVAEMGWAGKTNGELLKHMVESGSRLASVGCSSLRLIALHTFPPESHVTPRHEEPVRLWRSPLIPSTIVQPLIPQIKTHLKAKLKPGPVIIK
jgi:hypothetical protein